jgi:hypothetical protein
MRYFIYLPFALMCTACASPMKFSHETANYDDFQRDRYACIQEARFTATGGNFHEGSGSIRTGVAANQGIYLSCMALKGYRESPDGEFLPPSGAEVSMVR